MPLKCLLALLTASSLLGCASTAPSTQSYSFGLWGDMPYKRNGDDAKLPAVLRSINQSDIAFSVFNGDIKDGSSPCTDAVFTDALRMFGSMVKPVVYIPGDNEWTDCHRLNNGGFDGLERLAHLRRAMYPTPDSLGQSTLPLQHQGQVAGDAYFENVRFQRGAVVFAGFNMPGSNNNLVQSAKECSTQSARTPAQCDAGNAEYLERDAANVRWLEQTFHIARAEQARGVVVVFQADPGFDVPETYDVDESTLPRFNGYRNFMQQIVKQTENFKGEVLLVHGDSHFFKVDKPLYSPLKMLPNLTRVQTFGSPSLHWVKVTVNTLADPVFTVQPVTVQQP